MLPCRVLCVAVRFATMGCMDNTLDLMQDACCDRMDVFDRARMEQALMGPRHTIPSDAKSAEEIRDFILSTVREPTRAYNALADASLWNGEENT